MRADPPRPVRSRAPAAERRAAPADPAGPHAYAPRHATGTRPAESLGRTSAPLAIATLVSAAGPSWGDYLVRPGDTLTEIAGRTGTSTATLAAANRLRDPSLIRIGQRLRVPVRVTTPPRRSRPSTSLVLVRHRVRPGDTVIGLAARYRTTTRAIVTANRLRNASHIRTGATLAIPVRRATPAATSSASAGRMVVVRHRVRPGETLSGLARRYGTSTAALARANGLRSPYVIRIGQSLVVRVTRAPAAAGRSFAGRTYAASVVAEAARVRAILARTRQPSRAQVRALIVATARRQGVDPALALAISMQESGWNQRRVSVAGAIGAMQVMPATGTWMSQVVGRRLNLLDARDNVTAGVTLLRYLTRVTTDDRDAIAAYYQGLGNVRRHGYFPDTKRYVASVGALRQRYARG